MKVEDKPIFVVDASVVLKWVLPEKEDVSQALLLKEQFVQRKIVILVPAHFFTELSNILMKKLPHLALPFLSHLLISPLIQCQLSLELASTGFRLLQSYPKISFYDAFYHALALEKGALFITADESYYRVAKKEGNIILLREYPF